MRRMLVLAFGLAIMTASSHAADLDAIAHTHDGDLAAIASQLPADHPVGTKATIKLVSLKRAPNLHEPIVSTFIVDYAPGGSAVLHRVPDAGYVLVHVLAGAIRARAWDTGVGTYHTGETWIEPAFASDISTKNASSAEPARALVMLVTNDDAVAEAEGE
jgi:hypothetical protein